MARCCGRTRHASTPQSHSAFPGVFHVHGPSDSCPVATFADRPPGVSLVRLPTAPLAVEVNASLLVIPIVALQSGRFQMQFSAKARPPRLFSWPAQRVDFSDADATTPAPVLRRAVPGTPLAHVGAKSPATRVDFDLVAAHARPPVSRLH